MDLSYLPTLVGEALGSDATIGGLLLSIAILVMLGLAMSATRLHPIVTGGVLFGAVIMLTAIGWLTPLVLVAVLIILAFMAVVTGFRLAGGG